MKKYASGYFLTIPTSDGAMTRFTLAVTHARPGNGWLHAAHCFGKVRALDAYDPAYARHSRRGPKNKTRLTPGCDC